MAHPCPLHGGDIAVWGAARHDPDREPAGRRDRTRRRPRRAPSTTRCGNRSPAATSTSSVLDQDADLTHRARRTLPDRLLGRARRGPQRRMGRRDRWRRRRPRRRRNSSTAGSTAGTCPPSDAPANGDVQMDAAAHRDDRPVAERARRRRLHRAGGRLSAPPPDRRRSSAATGRVRPRACNQPATARGRDPPSPRSCRLLSPVRVGHWWRWPSASVPRRWDDPDCSARRGAGDLAGVRGDRALARRAVPTVPERRVAGHVRGPSPPGHARARPARRIAGDPDGRSDERPRGWSSGAPTDTCPGGHRPAPGSSLAYS